MKKAGIIMIIGSLLLLGLFKFPLWNIMLGAPQYPEPLGMNIHLNGIQGVQEFDLQNIDGLNHYIGMKTIPKPEDMWEFSVFPKVIIGMVILGVLIGVLGYFNKISYSFFLGWFILMSILGVLGMYDFNNWLIDYGSNLDPHAIIKVTNPNGTPMSYKPPLLGFQKLLNFDVTSLPHTGGYLMFIGMSLTIIAFWLGRKQTRRKQRNKNITYKTLKHYSIIALLLLFYSCNVGPEPIDYGNDGCHFCKMTIVDKVHAAEIVTQKGKVYKFDATECMVHFMDDFGTSEIKLYLSNNYTEPEILIDATTATFLISKNIPSPMGAFLSAFKNKTEAEKFQTEKGGELYTWETLLVKFKD